MKKSTDFYQLFPSVVSCVNDLPDGDNPKKLIQAGKNHKLSFADWLSCLLGDRKSVSAVVRAQMFLKIVGTPRTLFKMSYAELSQYLTEAETMRVYAAIQMSRFLLLEEPETKQIRSSSDAESFFRIHLPDHDVEHFLVAFLDRSNKIKKVLNISTGGVSATVVDPKVIFREALRELSSSIILCHNHPSGNLKPSQGDIEVTRKLVNAAKLLDMQVLDHLILTEHSYYSFADEGMI